MDRDALATKANEVGCLSRAPGAPSLASESGREVLLAWLQWNDPNGCYTDDLAATEGFAPMTTADAWAHLANVLADA